jgi:hypothetical protein
MKQLVLTGVTFVFICGSIFGQDFSRITTGAIVNDSGLSNGCCWGDYNNDGYLDLFVANGWPGDANNFLYSNNGDGTFTKITDGPVVTDMTNSIAGTWGDYNNDGFLDLFVANYKQNNMLYTNNGNGSFTKITTGSIVVDGGASFCCSWGDYDNDGNLDLIVGNRKAENNFLYRNNGDGTFTRITTGAIVNDAGETFGVVWGDYNYDGDLDLFVANAFGGNNLLYTNNGDGTFTKVMSGSVVSDGGNSYGGSWGDYDNDGDLDLFVANAGGEDNFLYANNGEGTFTKITAGVIVGDGGYSFGSNWGDYDNDGDLDLFIVNWADENNFLYSNDGNSNHWINIECLGTVSNTSAIGAKIRLKAVIDGDIVWQLREISGQTGGANGGQNSLNAEFGLGDAVVIDEIRVEWPSGINQTLYDKDVDQFLTIVETIQVSIDIKPGSDPNSINCKNENGIIPVAILTTNEFDAVTVDHTCGR